MEKNVKFYTDQGNKKIETEDYQGAIEDFTKAIEMEPDDYTYHQRADAKKNLEDYQGAIEDYSKAIELFTRWQYYYNRGLAKDNIKDYHGAIEDYSKVSELNSGFVWAYINRGGSKYNLKDYHGAIEDYNKANKIEPDNLSAYIMLGRSKYNLKDFQGAIEDYNKVIEIDPKYPTIYYFRGISKNGLGDYQGTIKDLNKAIEFDSEDGDCYYYRGIAKRELKDYLIAIKDFDKVIKLDPDYKLVYEQRGIAKRKLKDYKGAIEDFNNAIEKSKKANQSALQGDTYYNRAQAKHILKDFEGAVEDYNSAIFDSTWPVLYYYNLELAKSKLKLFEGDINDLKGDDIDSNYINAYFNEAKKIIELGGKGSAKTAIEALNKVIEGDSNFAEAYYYRAGSKYDIKDYHGAIKDYNKAINLKPNDKIAHCECGVAKSKINDFQGAIEDLSKAIDIDSKYIWAYIERANAKNELEELNGAIKDVSKVIELDPDYTDAYYLRGIVKSRLKDYEGALGDFNKAIKLNPKKSDLYKGRGDVKIILGDGSGAKQDMALSKLYKADTEESFNEALVNDFNQLKEQAKDSQIKWIKESLISIAHLRTESWKVFAKDEDALIRSAVALNPYISIDLLIELLDDNDIQVKLSVLKNTTCTDELLEKASDDNENYTSSRVRKAVALHSNTPKVIIKKLLKDDYRWVREAAAANPLINVDEITKLINSGDRYILKGFLVNPNCTKKDKDKIKNLLVDEKKYPKQYSKYKIMNDYTDMLESVGGEVSIDDVITALSDGDTWDYYATSFNNYYDYNDLWQEFGHKELVDKVLLPDGSYEDIVVKDPLNDLQRNDDCKNGDNNLGDKQFFCSGKGRSYGSWTSYDFELEDEFNSDYVCFIVETGPVICSYSYENNVKDIKSDAYLYVDIEGESEEEFGGADVTLYANTKEGIKLVDDLNELKEEMEKQTLDTEDENVIKTYLVKKYNLMNISDKE